MTNPSSALTNLHPDLVQVGPGHYRVGRKHFVHVKTPKTTCTYCDGHGKDPANKRRHCPQCRNTKVASVDVNYAHAHGYSFRVLGNCRTLADGIESYITGPLAMDPDDPASYVYYLDS